MNQAYNKKTVFLSILAALAILLTIACNALVGLLPANLQKLNTNGSDAYELSTKAEEYLQDVKEDVTLYFICQNGSRGLENEVYLFLSQVAAANQRISLEVIDPGVDSEFILPYGGAWPENMSIVVQSEKRYQLVSNSDLYYYYSSMLGRSMSASEYQELCEYALQMASQDEQYTEVYYNLVQSTSPMFDGCSRICNAIQYVLLDRVPTVYFLTDGATVPSESFINDLYLSGYNVLPLSSLNSIPEDCELLTIHRPSKDLSGAGMAVLKNYLSKGGRLFLTTNQYYGKWSNLNTVVAEYGLSYPDDMSTVICEGNQQYTYSDGTNYYPNHLISHRGDHPVNDYFSGQFSLANCHPIVVKEKEGVTLTKWLYTSESAYLANASDGKEVSKDGNYTFGAIAEKGDTSIVWLSGTDFSSSVNGNTQLLSLFGYLTDCNNQKVSLEGAVIPTATLYATSGQLIFWAVILVLLLPLGALMTGIAISSYRKRR